MTYQDDDQMLVRIMADACPTLAASPVLVAQQAAQAAELAGAPNRKALRREWRRLAAVR